MNHELLFEILDIYGAPPKLVRAVKTLYTNVFMNITVGKEQSSIPYTIGIQQGDNMAPLLFVFLMLAFADTLEKSGKMNGTSASSNTSSLKKVRKADC